jgi:putative methyltransferase (TIGR04325 family)
VSIRLVLGAILPPALTKVGSRLLHTRMVHRFAPGMRPEWEIIPGGWSVNSKSTEGWNVDSVAATQLQKWPQFLRLAQEAGSLGINHEGPSPLTNESLRSHNVVMSYGHALSVAAAQKRRLTLLDWGGGAGHYEVFSRALRPDLQLEYHCRDVPVLCGIGRQLLPHATFHERDEDALARSYDLAMASGSLHYSQDWKKTARNLAEVSAPYLFLTRLPSVRTSPAFVAVQRPHAVGYHTEYAGWVFNRDELIEHFTQIGMKLSREYLIGEGPAIYGAPEQPAYLGFLFRW